MHSTFGTLKYSQSQSSSHKNNSRKMPRFIINKLSIYPTDRIKLKK